MKTICCAAITAISALVCENASALPVDAGWAEAISSEIASGGMTMTWETGGSSVLKDVRISGEGWDLKADHLLHDGKSIDVLGATISSPVGGDGEMRIERIAMSDISFIGTIGHLFGNASGKDMTSSTCPTSRPEGASTMFFRNVVVEADRDALPANAADPEFIRIEMLDLSDGSVRSGASCATDLTLAAIGVDIVGIDGSSVSIERAFGSRRSNGTGKTQSSAVSFDLEDVSVADQTGLVSATIETLVADAEIDGVLPDLERIDAETVLRSLSSIKPSLDLTLKGLMIDTGMFFPGYMIEEAGIEDLDILRSDLETSLSVNDGIAEISLVSQTPSIANLAMDLRVGLPTSDAATLPSFVASRFPVPAVFLDFDLHDFELVYEDLGAGGILSDMTGSSPGVLVKDASSGIRNDLSGRLPDFILEKVYGIFAVMSDVAETGGRISMAPEEPVSLLNTVVQGMMNPDGFSQAMKAEVVLHN